MRFQFQISLPFHLEILNANPWHKISQIIYEILTSKPGLELGLEPGRTSMIATTLTLTLTFYDCHETLLLMVMWLAGGENGGKAKNCRVLHRVLTVNQGLWVYSIFRVYSICILCVNLGIKYSLTSNFGYKAYLGFLNFVFLHEF